MKLFLSMVTGMALGALALGGCSSSTDPDDGGPATVIYTPDRLFLDVTIPDSYEFSVASSRPATLETSWVLNGEVVGTQSTFQYMSGSVGLDTLVANTVIEGNSKDREWLITVLPSASLIPPPVPDVTIEDGEDPMDVVVSWHWINQSAFPIVDYLICSSYNGPITMENWDEADFQGAFENIPEQAGYTAVFTAEDNGMLPAETIWFAIRGRDDRGQLSSIAEIYRHTISFAWWIDGTAYDTDQNALPEIIIDYGCGSCRVNTDVNGDYTIGPFKNTDSVDIFTLSRNVDYPDQPFSSWYDFQFEPIFYSEESNTHDITLITRYGMDDLCQSYDGEFLNFFKQMTKTDVTTVLRPNHRLYKWEEYPIKVFIPDHVREADGLDFGENCRLGMSYWNLVMDEDYLVEVTDPAQAHIAFYFEEITGANGKTTLAEPPFYNLGDIIPEKIILGINNVILPTAQRVQETAMHELGHAMGLYDHVDNCADRPYLMNITSAHALDDGPENAVHIDEKRMLNAIRHLPQGIDVSGFSLE